jgi:hypothetical protein
VNRNQRRAARIKGPKGEWLYPQLLYIIDRDEKGRPKTLRMTYDEEEIGDVVPEERRDKAEMLLVFVGGETPGFTS